MIKTYRLLTPGFVSEERTIVLTVTVGTYNSIGTQKRGCRHSYVFSKRTFTSRNYADNA